MAKHVPIDNTEVEALRVMAGWSEDLHKLPSALEFYYLDASLDIFEIRIKCSPNDDGNYLALVKARTQEGKEKIAFANARDPQTALIYIVNALVEHSIRWRESKPWTPPLKGQVPEATGGVD